MKIILLIIVGLALVGLGAFAFLGVRSQSGAAPGVAAGRLAPCPSSPNCVSSEAGTPSEKKTEPLPLESWPNIASAVEALGGVVVTTKADYLSAVFTSKTFRFVDDIEFRKAADVVHVRSASRVGYSDRGVNRKRVEEIRAQLRR